MVPANGSSSSNGAIYLWKGIGANIKELSAARLISMDLAQNGDLVKINQGGGVEPEGF